MRQIVAKIVLTPLCPPRRVPGLRESAVAQATDAAGAESDCTAKRARSSEYAAWSNLKLKKSFTAAFKCGTALARACASV
jgi:hypothetical protein